MRPVLQLTTVAWPWPGPGPGPGPEAWPWPLKPGPGPGLAPKPWPRLSITFIGCFQHSRGLTSTGADPAGVAYR
jgi:hypothetical protein